MGGKREATAMASQNPAQRLAPLRKFLVLIDRPPLRLEFLPGTGEALVIAFSSVGQDPARLPAPEFVASATSGGRPALFVWDESRSWANDPGFAPALLDAVALLRRRQPLSRLMTIGQSMGGFAALVAASLLPVTAVLALGPQHSVTPGQPPLDSRWQDWTRRIATFRHPVAPLARGARITLMHGMADDLAQALCFPAAPGTDHLLFPGISHSGLAPHLKARGVLPGLIDAALANDRRRLLRIAASAGGRLRQRLLPDQLPR
ncbi:MAG: hypothetical protein IPL38_08605 [Rhodobacter sp.]|nr:hypothetical protein [Rhodobacter sp.]